MAPRNRWHIVTGYEDHKPMLRLTADGQPLSERDCTFIAEALLRHVNDMQRHRDQLAKERKQHAEDIAREEAAAPRRRKGR